ncbi:MAG: hypothetical protein KIH64_016780 [Mycobacterium sp.]|nr:hypothetical protein [Mycobacterium sp.]
MAGVLSAAGGFLLAVLWMDLMFDTQARGRDAVLGQPALESITAYYRRATTGSQPMGRLIAAVMALLLAGLVTEAVSGHTPGRLLAVSAVLAGGPIVLALVRTVPNAVRLGLGTGSPAELTRLARAVLADHILCAFGMAAFVAIWVFRSLN